MISPGNPQHSEVSSHRRNTTGWLVALGAAASSIPLFDVPVRASEPEYQRTKKIKWSGGNIPPATKILYQQLPRPWGKHRNFQVCGATLLHMVGEFSTAEVCQHSTPQLGPRTSSPFWQLLFSSATHFFMIIKMAGIFLKVSGWKYKNICFETTT